ncbi:MAG: immunoglobulin-like domain-containing protein [Ruminococcus sp.]
MKRIMTFVLSVLILVVLTACNQGENPPADGKLNLDKATIGIGATHTDVEGMEIQIVNATWNDDEIKLDVNWINKTGHDVVYGEAYDIEREDNGEWSSCVTLDNLAFDSIGYELKSGETQKKTYGLSDIFDILQNGKYRITSHCFVYEKGRGGESTKCELWAEFTVTRTGNTCKDIKKTFVDYEPQYIRTDGYHENIAYPVVKIIRSVQELNAYYEANKEFYSLEHRENPAPDNTIGFLDACDKYDEAYFEDQILVMVLIEEGSGSIRHNVDNVKTGSDGKLYIAIRTIVPKDGTDDMVQWHILLEPEKDVAVANESDVVVYLDGINPKTQPTTVRESGSYSNITLTIPRDWKYETERGNNSGEYCISFWPADQVEGKIKMRYYNAFGVCGTGLEEEEITIGSYKACKGTYDNKKVWDFISFADMPGSYVAINEGADKWWSQYGDEAMQILSTVKIAEGILTEQQAIELAKKDVTVEYNQTSSRFDTENGLWTVSFSKENTAGGDQVFTITHEGKIIDVEYGE